MENIIIDRTEEERNKDFEQAYADGLNVTIEELREAVEMMEEYEQDAYQNY